MKRFIYILMLAAVLLTTTVLGQKPIQTDFIGFRKTDPATCGRVGLRYFNTTALQERMCISTTGSGTWVAAAAPDGSGLDAFGLPNIGALGTRVRITGQLAVGNNDVYTVPAGYQLLTRYIFYWGVSTGYSVYSGVKEASNYRRLSTITAVGANAARGDAYVYGAESGEVVFLNSTVINVRYQIDGFLIPNTSPINVVRAWQTTQTAATDTLLYTVPAGKTAFFVAFGSGLWVAGAGSVVITNDSGVSGTAQVGFVPSGGTIGASYYGLLGVANNTASQAVMSTIPPFGQAGDKLYYQTSIANAGQTAWITLLEF